MGSVGNHVLIYWTNEDRSSWAWGTRVCPVSVDRVSVTGSGGHLQAGNSCVVTGPNGGRAPAIILEVFPATSWHTVHDTLDAHRRDQLEEQGAQTKIKLALAKFDEEQQRQTEAAPVAAGQLDEDDDDDVQYVPPPVQQPALERSDFKLLHVGTDEGSASTNGTAASQSSERTSCKKEPQSTFRERYPDRRREQQQLQRKRSTPSTSRRSRSSSAGGHKSRNVVNETRAEPSYRIKESGDRRSPVKQEATKRPRRQRNADRNRVGRRRARVSTAAADSDEENAVREGETAHQRPRKNCPTRCTTERTKPSTVCSSRPKAAPAAKRNDGGLPEEDYCRAFGCATPTHANLSFWLYCDSCEAAFHGCCVGVWTERISARYAEWFCQTCVANGRKLIARERNDHRSDPYETNASGRPTEAGTKRFIGELLARTGFPPASDILDIHKDGRALTAETLRASGFRKPVLIERAALLGLSVPGRPFGFKELSTLLGPHTIMCSVDVHSQSAGYKVDDLSLGAFVRYLTEEEVATARIAVIHIDSLEIPPTSKLYAMVEAPDVVRHLAWLPHVSTANGSTPLARKYVTLSSKDSFLNFDTNSTSGASTWFHVYKGAQTFYLIEPTDGHLKSLIQWMGSAAQCEVWLGAVDGITCHKVDVTEGQTLLLPCGWAASIYTPADSIVFTGDFFHDLAIPLQFRCQKSDGAYRKRKVRTPTNVGEDPDDAEDFLRLCYAALESHMDAVEEAGVEEQPVPGWRRLALEQLTKELKKAPKQTAMRIWDAKRNCDAVRDSEILLQKASLVLRDLQSVK